MIPFSLDEDVTKRLTEALLDLGLDATSVNRLGHKGLKDPQQLLIAARLIPTPDESWSAASCSAPVGRRGFSAGSSAPRDGEPADATVITRTSYETGVRYVHTRDFVLLHEAWHAWSADWNAREAARHSGVPLLYPDQGITITYLARAIHRFAIAHDAIDSRAFAWTRAEDWHEIAVAQPLG